MSFPHINASILSQYGSIRTSLTSPWEHRFNRLFSSINWANSVCPITLHKKRVISDNCQD